MAKVFVRVPSQDPDSGKPENKPKPKVKVRVKKQDPVAEYKAYEKDIDDNLPIYDTNARSFFNYYLNSPLYKQRLIGQGYTKPEDAISLRLANMAVTKTNKEYSSSSEYNQTAQKVQITPYDKLQSPNANLQSTLAHELSHVTGALHPKTPKFPSPMTMNDKEFFNILHRNKLYNTDESKLTPEQKLTYDHDINPHESKADIDAFRYKLFSDGMYDAGKQKFDKDVLRKAKQKYKGSDFTLDRLFNYFSDEDIIWMMNNIAKNKQDNKNNNIA